MPGSPAFNEKTFDRVGYLTGDYTAAERMTLDGTISKGIIYLSLAFLAAIGSWVAIRTNEGLGISLLFIGLIGGLGTGVFTTFKPASAPVVAPIYALFEGLLLGAVSSVFNAQYQGIVLNAVVITLSLAMMMFLAYKTRLIRATPAFVKGIVAATGAIFVTYAIWWIAQLFGVRDLFGLFSGSGLAIGISLFVVIIASLNLILDFNLVEKGVEQGAPKFMESYAAFGFLVTLFWLYLEVLRLLVNLNRR